MINRPIVRGLLLAIMALLFSGCVSSPPDDVDNVCEIFREKSGWYKDAKKSRARWDVPISVMMAIMHQESRFVATAKPPRKKIWGVIPGPRPSDAYGYSQAKMTHGSGTRGALEITVRTVMTLAMPLTSSVGTTT